MFKNMKIRARLVLSFGIVLAFLISIILISFNQIRVSHDMLSRIVDINNVRIRLANDMIDDARESAIDVRNILLAKYQKQSSENIRKIIAVLEQRRNIYRRTADSLKALITKEDTKGIELAAMVKNYADSAEKYQDKVIGLVVADKVNDGTDLMFGIAYPSVKHWINGVADLVRYNEARNTLRYKEADEAQTSARKLMIILGLAAIAMSLAIAILLTMSIVNPLKIATNLVITRDMTTDTSAYMKGGGELGFMIQLFSKDIKERLKLEGEMRASSLYARNLIEASLDPLVTISADGKITDVNKTTVDITGVSRERLIGSDFADYFTEPDKARTGYKQVFSQGVVRDYPLSLRHSSGKITDVLYNASVYKNEAGEVQGVFAAARDITDLKKKEEELKTYRDQLEEMVKTRTESLSNILDQVKETVNVLISSTSEIMAATTQVASGAAETASAITETTTTVEEVRQAAQLSSQKASRVSENAQQVAQVTQIGQKAVDETLNGMHEIQIQMESVANTIVRLSEQSQQIGGIIASVNDVADQSNLLAVNAAIEAAKAGEQGKGFAVVAQEIKGLAQQSKQATIQVRNILTDIQKATSAAVMATEQTSKAVDNGVKQSTQAGDAIKKLAESSSRAVEAATQIVASSQQQTVGMDQIGLAMQNINQAGTENAASMVQAEKAAKGLNELGQKLKALVEQYKI